jgi:hypothetical protein
MVDFGIWGVAWLPRYAAISHQSVAVILQKMFDIGLNTHYPCCLPTAQTFWSLGCSIGTTQGTPDLLRVSKTSYEVDQLF